MERNCVAYYRVSTDKQGLSGLGLEAQKQAVAAFMARSGWDLVAEYTEVETGKGKDALSIRPQLAQALTAAKKRKAVLIIAKLDRLTRNVAFISSLMDGEVDFVACDMPDATRLTVHIMAAVAEHETKTISARTKAALKIKAEQLALEGKRLGNPDPEKAVAAMVSAKQIQADRNAEKVRELLEAMKLEGLSQQKMADRLNKYGILSPTGQAWKQGQIHRTLKRLEI